MVILVPPKYYVINSSNTRKTRRFRVTTLLHKFNLFAGTWVDRYTQLLISRPISYLLTDMMLRWCYDAKMLRYYDVKNLRCYAVTMLLLRCYALTMLRSYDVTMLRPRMDFLYVPTETRALSHGITTTFGVLLYTERNEAVKSWNQGHPMRKSLPKYLNIIFVSELFKSIFV